MAGKMSTTFKLIVVVVGSLVWCGCMEHSEPSGPTMTVTTIDTDVDSGTGPDKDKEISCMVDSVSKPDVFWSDLEFFVEVDGSTVNGYVEHVSIDEFVSHGDTIILTSPAFEPTDRVTLKVLHSPTAGKALEWSVTCT